MSLHFSVINGSNPITLCAVEAFLNQQNIPKELLCAKIALVQGDPRQDAFVVIRQSKGGLIVGVVEIMVQLKFTRGLSKVCHIDSVWLASSLGDRSKQIHAQAENFVKEYYRKQQCYKTILAETDKQLMPLHETAGFERNQVYMVTPHKSHPQLLAGRL